MKYVALGFVLIMITFALSVAITAAVQYSDEQQIEEFIKSKGASPVPMSWRGKIGKGI